MAKTPIYLEVGAKKVFACAVEWPGWTRSGRTEAEAIETLGAYAERYAPVAEGAGIKFPETVADVFEVVEKVTGNPTTDFGAPGILADVDDADLSATALKRVAALLEASWTVFDKIRAKTPEELIKGPRGGGRNRDKMTDHVLGAESAYARKIGVKHRQPARDDIKAINAMRADIVEAIIHPADDTGWPVRYFARRTAWHVLDHAWEMQDKTPR